MNQTALIWTLAITLAALCMLLAIDYILIWKRVLREERSATARPTSAAEAVTARRDPTDVCGKRECLHGRTGSSAPTGCVDGIDLCGRERPVFEVKLPPDGKTLHLLIPTKAVADRFQAIGELLERMERNRLSMDGVEQLCKFSAALLSNNREGYIFTPADLAERLTSEDVGALLGAYLSWLTGVIKSLN